MNVWNHVSPFTYLLTKPLCSMSTRPAPQQASNKNHCPLRSTAFHRWSDFTFLRLWPWRYPMPLLWPGTSSHSMPTSLQIPKTATQTHCPLFLLRASLICHSRLPPLLSALILQSVLLFILKVASLNSWRDQGCRMQHSTKWMGRGMEPESALSPFECIVTSGWMKHF